MLEENLSFHKFWLCGELTPLLRFWNCKEESVYPSFVPQNRLTESYVGIFR